MPFAIDSGIVDTMIVCVETDVTRGVSVSSGEGVVCYAPVVALDSQMRIGITTNHIADVVFVLDQFCWLTAHCAIPRA